MAPHEIDERNERRDERILLAARRIVESRGLSALTRDTIANEAQLSAASVSNFRRVRITNGTHSRDGYRKRILSALMDQAIKEGDASMIRVGIADGCIRASDVPSHLRGI